LADLGVKLGRLTLALLLAIARTARPAGEQARDVVENLLLPGINLVRMHPVPLRQFRNRRILAQRLKRNLRLERCIKLLACLRHSLLHRLRQSRTFHTLANGPKSGVQLSSMPNAGLRNGSRNGLRVESSNSRSTSRRRFAYGRHICICVAVRGDSGLLSVVTGTFVSAFAMESS